MIRIKLPIHCRIVPNNSSLPPTTTFVFVISKYGHYTLSYLLTSFGQVLCQVFYLHYHLILTTLRYYGISTLQMKQWNWKGLACSQAPI